MAKTAVPGASRGTVFKMDPADIVIIGLDTRDGPEHPLYDDRIRLALDEGLVLNIMARGVLVPILGRKNGPRVEVVDGRQRVRCAREANKRLKKEGLKPVKIEVSLKRPKDEKAALGMLITTNENRINDDYVARARKAQRLLDLGADEDEVANDFGCNAQTIKNLLKILELSPKVQKAIQAREIGYIAAISLTDLPQKDQEETLAAMVASGNTGTDEAKRLRRSRQKQNGKADETPRAKKVPTKILRKVAEDEEFTSTLSPDAKALLLWVLGDENAARRVKGLTALLKD